MLRAEPSRLTARQPLWWGLALICWIAMLVLALAWELALAPLRPGGSWLVIKALPLLVLLPGIARARASTLQWSTLLILFYLAEGVIRALEPAPTRWVASAQAAVALAFFVAAVAYLHPLKRAARLRAQR